MKSYRIILKDGKYYPQKLHKFMWIVPYYSNFEEHDIDKLGYIWCYDVAFASAREAARYIGNVKRSLIDPAIIKYID